MLYHNSLKYVLAVILLSLIAIAPAKSAQAQNCNPACVGLSVEVYCYHNLPPYRFRPHDTEPNNTYYYELQNLSTGQNFSGYMPYQGQGATERYYGTNVYPNYPAGNYRARFQHIPPPIPGAWSAWLYKSVGQGGAISWLFGYMFQPEHPVCT